MAIQVHIPTPLRPQADNQAVVEVEGNTVQRALENLGSRFPALFQRVFENGQVRRFINIYLNDEDIRYLDNLKTAVKDGDSLSIIPAVAGG
jgi:sulfur-carrier protein